MRLSLSADFIYNNSDYLNEKSEGEGCREVEKWDAVLNIIGAWSTGGNPLLVWARR